MTPRRTRARSSRALETRDEAPRRPSRPFRILNRLWDGGHSPRDQKLLSFTDNRQDAALQAGHFNDFVQVVRLRAGIRQALETATGGILDYASLGEAIFNSLSLPFRDYGNRDAEPELAPVKRKYEEALQDYLLFRALADLRRSWRIVLPNLEQCALLDIDYLDLDEITARGRILGRPRDSEQPRTSGTPRVLGCRPRLLPA